jgi:hypothetical protein
MTKTGKQLRAFRSALFSVLLVVAAMALSAPFAQATASTAAAEGFRVPYGNTYTAGTATFFNRSVSVVGEQKALSSSGCRYTYVEARTSGGSLLDWNVSQITCAASENYQIPLVADVAGGAAYVDVYLMYWNGDNTEYPLASARVRR